MFVVEVDAPGVNSPPLPFPFSLGDIPPFGSEAPTTVVDDLVDLRAPYRLNRLRPPCLSPCCFRSEMVIAMTIFIG